MALIAAMDVSHNGRVKCMETTGSIFEIDDSDVFKLMERPTPVNVARNKSFDERSLNSEFSITLSPRFNHRNHQEFGSPTERSGFSTPRSGGHFEPNPMVAEAWESLRRSLVYHRGQPVGTIAALDHSVEELNYNQSWEKRIDQFKLGEGVMPASFKVLHKPEKNIETLIADFGESAIRRVAPVDFWWIILLRAYTKSTGDSSLAETPDCQRGMRLILNLYLSEGFDTFPTLLCVDGCCMIDRRMGVYGYPIEIQALFFMALRCALILLKHDDEGKELIDRVVARLRALSYHMRINKFNVMPDSLPDWVFDFVPTRGGYFIGNVSPARMDFRWFCLATPEQAAAIMDLIESRWGELVGEMPLKICYPAIESHEWRVVTGCDPKDTRWSYHNGRSWPVLLWLLTAACIKTGRPQIARRAIELAETRLSRDHWPEYYDGKVGRFVGKQARKYQTWSIAGYLVAKMMLEDPSHLGIISLEEDKQMKALVKRSASWTC
ncbi:beta-fructofuranosidase, putative [Ricinus communis]|uniref:Alkaline/neutral invertase n=1 Tax=Ricinus communis TaxID=3988 RepID=B9R891_RICCO|nr:beta-fructofuranosidase, putative [Ricinus communis]